MYFDENIIKGYVFSNHVFGKSKLVRNAQHLYYLHWQMNKKGPNINDIIKLSPKQYQEIKKLLGPVKETHEKIISDRSKAVEYIHETNSKYYMRVKRYLKKNKLEDQHGFKIGTSNKICETP